MAISSATICSNALGLLSQEPILSLLDDSVRARQCNQHFETVRDAMLESHPWNFATKRTLLVAEATPPAFGFSVSYLLPGDYLKVQEIYPDYVEYVIEGNSLYANYSGIGIVYTRILVDYNQYNPLFVLALEYQLAAVLAPIVKRDFKLVQVFEQLADSWVKKAKISDAQASRSKEVKSDDLITVRWVA